MNTKKIISFSLWGNNPKYTIGALRNAELMPKIYPGWIARFYIGLSVPQDIIDNLKSFPNNEVIIMDESGDWNSMFWRFMTIDEDDVTINLSRDTDSRLSMREKLCVDEFINSDKLFHNMIDHPWHAGIMGGMHGIKKGLVDNMSHLISQWSKTNQWQTDQQFLNSIIAPIASQSILLHDSIHLNNFPSERENYHFVGEIFDQDDNRGEHYSVFF